MTAEEVKRKLTAILSADVKGYSRLMGEDEEWTLRTLKSYKEAMGTLVQQHRGRVVDAPGDSVLADFGSVVDAVQCAVKIQKELKTRNAELPENRRMEFRMGINLGDVVEEEDKIFGDGVNIAARLEGLADAGGICISGTTYDQVKNKLPLGYQFLGEQTVKNISEPIRIYKVLMEPKAAGKLLGEKRPRQWQRATIGLLVILIGVIVGFGIWKFYIPPTPKPEIVSKEKITAPQAEKPSAPIPPTAEPTLKEKAQPPISKKPSKVVAPVTPKVEVSSKDKMAFPLPDKPSIAVLPFTNMSDDPRQEFFVDGLAEEIINGLCRIPEIFVIARNSSFTYKGKAVDVKQVAREMGVQYVLEGSVRKEGSRIRVGAQLVDALKGHHVFSERYEGEMKDLFAFQDEITMKILVSILGEMSRGKAAQLGTIGTTNLNAFLKLMEIGPITARGMNRDTNAMMRMVAEEAIALDPGWHAPYSYLAYTYFNDVLFLASSDPRASFAKAIQTAQKAISLDQNQPRPYCVLCMTHIFMREFDKAIASAERAVALGPNFGEAYWILGTALYHACRPEEAIPYFKKAMRLSPIPDLICLQNLGGSYRMLRQYDDAEATFKKLLERAPDHLLGHLGLLNVLVEMDRMEEARVEAFEALRINPQFSAERYSRMLVFKEQPEVDRFISNLRKAGLK